MLHSLRQRKGRAAAIAACALVCGCSQTEWDGASSIAEVQQPVEKVFQVDLDLEHGAKINTGALREETANGTIADDYLTDNDKKYDAHWEGEGIPVEIRGSRDYLRYLSFRIEDGDASPKDRSELQLRHDVQFGEFVYLGFRIMVPSTTIVPADADFNYVQQFWQCTPLSPIAGFSLDQRTSGLTWSLVVRTDPDGPNQGCHTEPGNETDPAIIAAKKHTWSPFGGLLMPDVWHTFVLRIKMDPAGGGSVKVWQDGNPLDTFPTKPECQASDPTGWYGPIGYRHTNTNGCEQRAHAKIGVYREGLEEAAEVRYDDVRLGNDFNLVKPW